MGAPKRPPARRRSRGGPEAMRERGGNASAVWCERSGPARGLNGGKAGPWGQTG